MEKILMIRHGQYAVNVYETDIGLTEEGKESILSLCDSLDSILKNKSNYLLASDEQRAIETAQIIAQRYGLSQDIQEDYSLVQPITEILPDMLNHWKKDAKNSDNLVLVTHEHVIEDYAPLIHEIEFGKIQSFPRLGHGACIIFDLKDKKCELVDNSRVSYW